MSEKERKCIVIVRVRGNVGIRREFGDVLRMMHLTRKNHATIIQGRPSYLGMIQRVKDYVTWGEVSPKTVSLLLKERGRLAANRRLTDHYVKEKLGYESIEDLAKAICEFEVNFWRTPGVKPVFRLRPPRGGFRKSIKKPRPDGELGYRGEAINELIARMV